MGLSEQTLSVYRLSWFSDLGPRFDRFSAFLNGLGSVGYDLLRSRPEPTSFRRAS
jgi:hypothetical protein